MFLLVFENKSATKIVAVIGIDSAFTETVMAGANVASLDLQEGGRRCFHRADVIGVIGTPSLEALQEKMAPSIGRILWAADLSKPHLAPDPVPLSDEEDISSMIQHEDGSRAVRLALTRADVDAIAGVTKRGEMQCLAAVGTAGAAAGVDLLVMLQVFEDAEAREVESEKLSARREARSVLSGEWKAVGQA